MPNSFEAIRDRLPTLYRPDDADVAVPSVPLAPADVVHVRAVPGGPPFEAELRAERGGVLIELPEAARIHEIRLRRGKAPGTGYALELYRMHDGSPAAVPAAVAGARNSVGRFSSSPSAARLLLRMRQKGLTSLLMQAAADILDTLEEEASDVLHAHWFEFADRATFHPHFVTSRRLRRLGAANPADPEDRLALDTFPYIHDLGRMASLLALPFWAEPAALREVVESYRTRIRRTVEMYRGGLGTVAALRLMVETSLPVDPTRPPESRDRPFSLEEFAPVVPRGAQAATAGPPDGAVGPLMRFTFANDGLADAAPAAYVQGLEPVAGVTSATDNPMLELFDTRVALAYAGTIAPDRTLRVRPAYDSWIGGSDGVARARSEPTQTPADPTAPGPWAEVEEGPEGEAVAFTQTRDRYLWAGVNAGGAGSLWRFDGRDWNAVFADLPEILCLASDGDDLLAGTASGLVRAALDADAEERVLSPDVGDLDGPAVAALLKSSSGTWYAATAQGPAVVDGEALQPFGFEDTPTFALHEDAGDTLHVGSALGAFQFQPGTGRWYWYRGALAAEQERDWEEYHPQAEAEAQNFPSDEAVFLPPVRAILRGPDSSLWFGTDAGLARYTARRAGDGPLAFTTVLEAFPDLGTGRVFAIAKDERGTIWFATERGLLRFDGRDLWQYRGASQIWERLGRPELMYSETAGPRARGAWRFHRASGKWQRSDPSEQGGEWISFQDEPRTGEEPAAMTVAWTDAAAADLLTGFDPATLAFDGVEPVAPDDLRIRYKAHDTRIVDGGIPALPRLPVGTSTWRYLSLEPETIVAPERRPAWTIEGRLLAPPEDAAAAPEGRYDIATPPPRRAFDEAVFPWPPAARVWFAWEARRPLTVLVRLGLQSPDDHLEPVVLERVREGVRQVRPAGVRTLIAVGENIEQGDGNG